MIHDVIPKQYHKISLQQNTWHDNVLDKVNKSPWGRLQNMTPHDAYIITIHAQTTTLANISNEQTE